jgi:hypothetical protein
MPDFEQKPYCPDHPFKADGNLIYLLQNSGKPPYDMYNDITIRVDQFPGGVNKMPREVMQRFITHLHAAANDFLWEECGI